MPGRDPFLRGWVKIPTNLLEQEDFCTLSFEERGVMFTSLLYTTARGQAPGYFRDKATGQPMSLAHIVRRMSPDLPQAERHERTILTSFDTFIQRELFTYDDRNGYAFAAEYTDQFLNDLNLTAKRKYDTERQADLRRRKKAAAEAKKPIQLRRVEDA